MSNITKSIKYVIKDEEHKLYYDSNIDDYVSDINQAVKYPTEQEAIERLKKLQDVGFYTIVKVLIIEKQ
jgi:hypothetical protein